MEVDVALAEREAVKTDPPSVRHMPRRETKKGRERTQEER